jgi:hypothetical protein
MKGRFRMREIEGKIGGYKEKLFYYKKIQIVIRIIIFHLFENLNKILFYLLNFNKI